MAMAFWGIEVKSDQVFDVKIGKGTYLNLDHVTLGEIEGSVSVIVHIIVDGKKLVLAALDPECLPTESLSLLFSKNFQISHNLKNGSVYLFGSTQEVKKKDERNYVEEYTDSDIEYY